MKKSTLSIAVLAIGTLCHQGTHSFLGPCAPLLAPAKVAVVNAALASKLGSLTGAQLQEILGDKVVKRYNKDLCNQDGSIGSVRLNAAKTHVIVGGYTLSNKLNKVVLDAVQERLEMDEIVNSAIAESAKKVAAQKRKEQQRADVERAELYSKNIGAELMQGWADVIDAQYKEQSEILEDNLLDDDWAGWARKSLDGRKTPLQEYYNKLQKDSPDMVQEEQTLEDYIKSLSSQEPLVGEKTQFDWKQFAKDNKEPIVAVGLIAAGGAGLYAGKKWQEQAVEA